MTAKRRSVRSLLIAGAVILVAAVVLAFPRLTTTIETQLYTRRIPTAPPLSVLLTPGIAQTALLSANDGNAVLPPTATLSPTPPLSVEVEASKVVPTAGATSAVTLQPSPTLTTVWAGVAPTRVRMPSIDLDAPVVPIGWKVTTIDGQSQAIWDVPDGGRAGWHSTSMPLGVPGNTVLNGHNTSKGEVFRDLYKAEIGAQIFMEGEDGEIYAYRIGEKYILREAGQSLSVRLENARYIQQTSDERLTLVTCHPYGSLANRLVLIAFPVTDTNLERGGAN